MNTDQEIAIETKTPRRRWRPQFTIVQMLLVFLIVALCVANWLLRQENEKYRKENRFLSAIAQSSNVSQIGDVEFSFPDARSYSTFREHLKAGYSRRVFITLNPSKQYRLCYATQGLQSDTNLKPIPGKQINLNFNNSIAQNRILEISWIYSPFQIDHSNKQLVDKWLLSSRMISNSKEGGIDQFNRIEEIICETLFSEETLLTNQIVIDSWDRYELNSLPHDFNNHLTLLRFLDSDSTPDNQYGIHIWLEEVK